MRNSPSLVSALWIFLATLASQGSAVQGQIGGNSTFNFLNLVGSARVAAMGGHFLAVRDHDLNLAVDNPSLITPSMHNTLSLSFVDYYSDISYGYAAYARTFEKFGSFTGTMRYLNYGEFQYADETGQTYGTFSAGDYAFQLGWGRALDSMFSIGSNLKFIYSDYELYSATGLAVDVSGTWQARESGLTLTFLARNIGRQLNAYTIGDPAPLPFDLQLGLSNRLRHVPLRYSILLTNLQKFDLGFDDPSEPEVDPLTGEPIKENKVEELADELMRHVVIGAELSPSRNLSFRLGYNYRKRQELKVDSRLSTVGLSWGIGLRISRFHFNYARSAFHLAGSPNYLTVTTNLSDFFGGD